MTFTQSFLLSFSLYVVAYPEPDKSITAITTYPATLGNDSPPIRCEFPNGTLSVMYYTVHWWKGAETLAKWNDDTQINSKYEIHDDFSLVVRDVTAMDASDAYYCTVAVEYEKNNVVTNYGIDYELVVNGKGLFSWFVSMCLDGKLFTNFSVGKNLEYQM